MRNFINIITEAARLDELWDRDGPAIDWETQGEKWHGVLTSGQRQFKVDFVRSGEDKWGISFGKANAAADTGTVEEALPVFKSVMTGVIELIHKENPDLIWFSGTTDSRFRLYRSLLNRYKPVLEGMGYRISCEMTYFFIIKNKSITEGEHTPPEYDPDDEAHYDALDKTGFFGAQAAGCVLMAKTTGRLMLVHRSEGVEQPNTWGNVGGAHHADERPADAAHRELHEETGYSGRVQMVPLMVFQSGSFRYCNFLAIVEDEFTPSLGWEATDHVWCKLGDWPHPLHFGVEALFNDSESMKVLQHYASLFGGQQ